MITGRPWARSRWREESCASARSRPGACGPADRTLQAGQRRPFAAGHVHDVVNVWTEPAVSVHAYSPPLTVMRRSELTAGGLIHTTTEHSELNW